MEKLIVKSDVLEEQYHFYKHKSGLGILLYPMEGFSSAYALFGTNYGSIDTIFKTQHDNDFTMVPEGIAHFLEHKLFESEDGDAFELFAQTGACANAFTSFEKTCYLFSTTSNFDESLKALISFVQDPYFTEQTVQKEQGIIGQEIRMYEDDPGWRVFFNLLTALYHNNPVRIDIAGTIDSIAQIDKDLLYRCYHTFYNLNNMVVSIAGNFDAESAIQIIEENLKDCEKIEITTKTPEEPESVVESEHVQNLQIALPLFNLGYKEKTVKPENELETQIKFEIILRAIAGRGSDLYRRMYEEGLINDTFGKEVFCGRGYFTNVFSGESKDPRRVRMLIDEEIRRFQKEGLSVETFERVRKAFYGDAVISFNDVEQVANEMVTAYFSGRGIYDTLDVIAKVTCDEVNQLLRESFYAERSAISIINPVQK